MTDFAPRTDSTMPTPRLRRKSQSPLISKYTRTTSTFILHHGVPRLVGQEGSRVQIWDPMLPGWATGLGGRFLGFLFCRGTNRPRTPLQVRWFSGTSTNALQLFVVACCRCVCPLSVQIKLKLDFNGSKRVAAVYEGYTFAKLHQVCLLLASCCCDTLCPRHLGLFSRKASGTAAGAAPRSVHTRARAYWGCVVDLVLFVSSVCPPCAPRYTVKTCPLLYFRRDGLLMRCLRIEHVDFMAVVHACSHGSSRPYTQHCIILVYVFDRFSQERFFREISAGRYFPQHTWCSTPSLSPA